jgi:hypothetical protein
MRESIIAAFFITLVSGYLVPPPEGSKVNADTISDCSNWIKISSTANSDCSQAVKDAGITLDQLKAYLCTQISTKRNTC